MAIKQQFLETKDNLSFAEKLKQRFTPIDTRVKVSEESDDWYQMIINSFDFSSVLPDFSNIRLLEKRRNALNSAVTSLRNKVSTIVEVLYQVLYCYGYNPNLKDGVNSTSAYKSHLKSFYRLWFEFADYIVRQQNQDAWVDLFKWKICSFYAFVNLQDAVPPKNKDPAYSVAPGELFFGRALRFVKLIGLRSLDDLKSLAESILMSKKGCPAVSDDMIGTAEGNTFQLLTGGSCNTEPLTHLSSYTWEGEECPYEYPTPSFEVPYRTTCRDGPTMRQLKGKDLFEMSRIKRELVRTTEELFRRKKFDSTDLLKPFFPSVSANYLANANALGCVGVLDNWMSDRYGSFQTKLSERQIEFRETWGIPTPMESMSRGEPPVDWYNLEEYYPDISDAMLANAHDNGNYDEFLEWNQQMLELPKDMKEDILKFELKNGKFSEFFSDKFGDQMDQDQEDLEGFTKDGIYLEIDKEVMQEKWRQLFEKCWSRAQDESPKTVCVGLPEPLKVRVITKGPAYTYFVLKPFQKFLWKTLKAHPTFRLIGEPLTEDIVNDVFGQNDNFGNYILSGDYKASTDNIYSWCSRSVVETLFETINFGDLSKEIVEDYKKLVLNALINHLILRPDKNKEYRKSNPNDPELNQFFLPQKHGQLMGSIISFPILCIINAAVCRLAMEQDRSRCFKKYLLKDLPLLINGDDCVFRGSKYLKKIWESIISSVGLTSSVGKTYFSQILLVMNSLSFHSSWEKPWVLKKFVNFGLIAGRSRSGNLEKELSAYGGLQAELKRTCPQQCWLRANEIFFHIHRKKFLRYKVPWYLPQWLGGLGLEPLPTVTKDLYPDLRKASTFINSGMTFQSPPTKNEWQINVLTEKITRPFLGFTENCFAGKINGKETVSKDYYNWLVVASMFVSTKSEMHKALLSEEFESKENAYWQRMQRRWSKDYTPIGSCRTLASLQRSPNTPVRAILLK